ncbi:putative ribonuclease H-like domain-containing protein [Tanacetum coccineum]
MAFMSSSSSTNEVNTAYGVSTANTQVSPSSTQVSTASTQLALLSMRTRKFFQKTGRNITINRSDTAGYDKSKVECFNCHKLGHFARECRGPRNQDNRSRNQDSSRRTINVEEISSKALLVINGAGFDWSFMADEEVPTNMALMAFSDSEEFQQLKFEGYRPKTSKSVNEDTFNEVRESPDAPLVEELVLNDKLEKKTIFPTVAKINLLDLNNKKNQLGNHFDHLQANCNNHQRERVVSGNNYTRVNYNYFAQKAHPSAQRNMVLRAVLMKTGLRTVNTARPVNTAHPKTTVYSARPMSHFSKSARPKAVNTTRPNTTIVNAVRANQVNAVKASSCWVWRPTKLNSASITFKRHNYVDALAKSKLATCPVSQTSMNLMEDMLPLGEEPKEKELLVLLKVPRKNNMYSVDMKNIVPKESLTYLVAKASLDESMLWHSRLASKDETSGILKSFITQIENLVDKKVKIIRCDNGTEFKNRVMSEFCEMKGIKREFSNRVLVVKPHNKTPYELFKGRTPSLSFMRPFGCHVIILNTLDHLGKFDGKSDDGFFVGYSLNSKDFRVSNIRTRKVEENLHVRFLEDKPIIAGDGPKWLFDIDVLIESMNYVPVVACTNSNDFVGTKKSIGAGQSNKETRSSQDYILMPLWKDGLLFDSSSKNASNDEPQPSSDAAKKDDESENKEIITAPLEATHDDFFGDAIELDMSNISTTYQVHSTPITRIHKYHSLDNVISDVLSSVQARRMTKTTNEQGFISAVYEGKTNEDLHTCMFACFLSQEEPKRIAKALSDLAWVEATQEELL